jgi:hypothetical protein
MNTQKQITEVKYHEMSWRDSPDDLWNLFNLAPKELRYIYCDRDYWGDHALGWEGLRVRRKKLRREFVVSPERQTPYEGPDKERERVSERRRKVAPKVGGAALNLVSLQVPPEHLRYHEKLQEALNEHGSVDKARFSDYQMGYKDKDGEAQTHQLHSERFEVTFDHDPLWEPIHAIRLEKPLKRRKTPEAWKLYPETTVVVPDIQFPFVDEKALDVYYQILGDLKRVDNLVQLGDALDLTAYSKYVGSEIYKDATQAALVQALDFFRTCRTLAPHAKIVYLEGNHERRLPNDILNNHKANWRLRPADDLNGDPLVSVPRMVGLASVDVEYLPGYPNNRYWVTDNLQIIHGDKTGRNEARKIMNSEKISTIYGHTHRLNHEMDTVNFRDDATYRHSFGSGTLSRLDKHVPGIHTGYDLEGEPVGNHQENWQHGFLIITHDNGNAHVEQVVIDTFNGYRAMFRGKVYSPRSADGESDN